MTIPQEAVEAASRILSAEKEYYDTWDEARDILTAALPALERQIRERVAKEIEAARPAVHPARKGGKAAHYALTNAARIARGYWL